MSINSDIYYRRGYYGIIKNNMKFFDRGAVLKDLFIRGIEVDWSSVSEDGYVYDIKCLRNLKKLEFENPVTFFVGENGTGKSTLLEGIAVAYGFNAEGGTKNYRFSTFDSHSDLYRSLKIIKGPVRAYSNYYLRAESFYNVASKAEEYRGNDPAEVYYAETGGRSFHEQSHGESFLSLVQGKFLPKGVYILDEPEAALSPQRQLTLLIEIEALASRGAQFIIASHSPILLGLPGADILSFDGGSIHKCSYTDTDSYRITELFINDRENLLRKLLEDK